ncbi:MAG: hypothetical protein R3F11_27660 [Verrucomicrobiales bacterium]
MIATASLAAAAATTTTAVAADFFGRPKSTPMLPRRSAFTRRRGG